MWVEWELLVPHEVILSRLNLESMPALAVTQIPMTQMGMTTIKEELVTAMILKVQIPT